MEDREWLTMLQYMQNIRLFGSLYAPRAQRGKTLSSQTLDLLSRVLIAEEPPTPQKLSRQMHLQKSVVSRLVAYLSESGLLRRQRNAMDCRSYTLFVTEGGRRKLEDAYRYYLEPLYTLRRSLGKERFQELMNLIRQADQAWKEKEDA